MKELHPALLVLLMAMPLGVAERDVTVVREHGKVLLSNDRVRVALDAADGRWDATWRGGADAAVWRDRFSVEVDGRLLSPRAAKTETASCRDALGSAVEICQRWGQGVVLERRIRLYRDRPAIVLLAQATNQTAHDVTLGRVRMLDVAGALGGGWRLADGGQPPAAVAFPAPAPACRPAPDEKTGPPVQQHCGMGVLALKHPRSTTTLVLGSLSARQCLPVISDRFERGKGGTSLGIDYVFERRVLPPGGTIAFDPVWLAVEENGFDALEHYGDAVAALAAPVRTGANALWCSWYPIRMDISEEITLANAAIAARHFKPLGLDVMQLDHGWQRGDVCGDWQANQRFPHGFKWLAEQLQSRYGMKLGLWIAPTQVAFNSQLFHDHPDWMLKNAQGKPASMGRWFWVPNPDMGLLDASHPDAEKWIEETFRRLTAEGAQYFKIDFINGSPALPRAMAAIRRGAGPNAWIRYCQTPPLLSAGLANSTYIGDDTGDAGITGWMNLERINAPLLAASYWANDRLYHRELCDMSVGPKADVEEARFRLSLMTLAGCSISFSDDFRALTLPRIRMMQQCLPPGNPRGRPLDLFERERPSLWHMHCRNEAGSWDVVGVFNFEDQPQERRVELAALGLPADAEVAVFEFWQEKFLGRHRRDVRLMLAPRTARILLIHRAATGPQMIATNMHLLGGYHEIKRLAWDEKRLLLAGRYERAAGLGGKVYFLLPDGYWPLADSPAAKGLTRWSKVGHNLWCQEVQFQDSGLDWTTPFERAPSGG
jgi:alpha-galactosidase